MTMCTMYVGNLADPKFSLEGGNWEHNVPAALTPPFPFRAGNHYFSLFLDWLASRQLEPKQVDWGTTVAKVTKQQILDYLSFCYNSDPSYTDPKRMDSWQGQPYLVDQLKKVKEFVAALDDEGMYSLVAMES